jgi:hypothetical protein
VASLPFFSPFLAGVLCLAGVLSVIEPSVIWLTQLPASSHVLESPKVVALRFRQQVGQIFGETSGNGFATAQTASDLKIGNRDIVAKCRFPAHGCSGQTIFRLQILKAGTTIARTTTIFAGAN